MDTRMRGYDRLFVMPDLIGHPWFWSHGYPHARVWQL